MRIGLVLPGFSADETDWCIPALRHFARALSQTDELTIVATRYPYRAARYTIDGARVTAILPDGRATYDGRATKEENFSERTGLATPHDTGLVAAGPPICDARYLDALPLPDGTLQLFEEAPLPDGSHELRTRNVKTLRSSA